MLTTIPYDRQKVVDYATTWALSYNPRYYDFTNLGGDCTNFASQCVFAGCGVMNFTPVTGWYFTDLQNRSPSWTGVDFFYNFIVFNSGAGPYGTVADLSGARIGDIIQLQDRQGKFYHSLVITAVLNGVIFVSAHDFNALNRPLSSYNYYALRCIHFFAARKYI